MSSIVFLIYSFQVYFVNIQSKVWIFMFFLQFCIYNYVLYIIKLCIIY